MDGNEELETTRKERQPMDWTTVKFPRKKREKRPVLTETMNDMVTEELNKHVETNYRQDNIPKTKPQKEMTPELRQKIIQNMLLKSGLYVGVGPITQDHVEKVEKVLINKGVLNKSEKPQIRKQRTIKSLIKSWTRRNLLMTEQDWDQMEVENIIQSQNSDIIYIQCKNQEDASRITSKAKNLPKDTGPETPKIIMYVDKRARKRHKALLNIAKSMREHSKNTIQTSIRTRKNDFLLRKRTKGDSTPWTEIPPVLISQTIPEFEVGIYTDMINIENNIKEDDVMEEDSEEIEEITKDILEENNANKKRDRTKEETLLENTKKGKLYSEESSPENSEAEETEDQNRTDRDLNSTPIQVEDTTPPLNKIPSQSRTLQHSKKFKPQIEHYFSVPDTPLSRIKTQELIKYQTIPETPEANVIKAITKKTRDNSKNDDELIQDLVNTTKKTPINHE